MAENIIGIDIGGSKIIVACFAKNRILKMVKFKTPRNITLFKKKLLRAVNSLCNEHSANKVALGVAGVIEGYILKKSPNIQYLTNFNFGKLFPRELEIKIDNDARCFARSESNFKKTFKYRSFFALILGTGVGRARVNGGSVLRIKRFEYPEKWEATYQKLSFNKDKAELLNLLANKTVALTKLMRIKALVVGGGVTKHKGFVTGFRNRLMREGFPVKVLKSKSGRLAVARGATLLFSQKMK